MTSQKVTQKNGLSVKKIRSTAFQLACLGGQAGRQLAPTVGMLRGTGSVVPHTPSRSLAIGRITLARRSVRRRARNRTATPPGIRPTRGHVQTTAASTSMDGGNDWGCRVAPSDDSVGAPTEPNRPLPCLLTGARGWVPCFLSATIKTLRFLSPVRLSLPTGFL